jgi:hypothetical protein
MIGNSAADRKPAAQAQFGIHPHTPRHFMLKAKEPESFDSGSF